MRPTDRSQLQEIDGLNQRSSSRRNLQSSSSSYYHLSIKLISVLLIALLVWKNFQTNLLLFMTELNMNNNIQYRENVSFSVPPPPSDENNNDNKELLHPQEFYRREEPMTPERMTHLRGPDGPKYNVLVTGAAGFIGMSTALELKRIGMAPIGYDNVNSYYSTELKELRIEQLKLQNIELVRGDVCDTETLKKTIKTHNITRVIHLAAQAGVRYSIEKPLEYIRNNVECFVRLLETMVELDLAGGRSNSKDSLVYASSSSVYGNSAQIPFVESDRLEDPASLYATTKRSDELIAQTYFNLHNVTSIGLRFFTVYGPYGRPDMAPWIFTDRISNGETIRVFNHGNSRRDFTYIDDIVQGVVNSLLVKVDKPEYINLGRGKPVVLGDFVNIVQKQVGIKAKINSIGMQMGDVPVTYADITKARRMLGYKPHTLIEDGITKFVSWFKQHNASKYRFS